MRAELLAELDRDWQAFLDSFDGLPDSALTQSGAVGTWSVRDVMAHITTWEQEAVDGIPLLVAHVAPPGYTKYGGVDGFNAQKTAEKESLPLARIRQDLTATHRTLLGKIADIPDDVVDAQFERRLGEDTWSHYREHAGQVQAWRRRH